MVSLRRGADTPSGGVSALERAPAKNEPWDSICTTGKVIAPAFVYADEAGLRQHLGGVCAVESHLLPCKP